jgi:hypothetical protein
MSKKINIKKLSYDLDINIVPPEMFYGREEVYLDWSKLDYTQEAKNEYYLKKILKLDSNDEYNKLIENAILLSITN